MKPLRALFIGDYTLLTRCADAFHGAGHVVVGVVSGDARIGQWARDRGHMLIEKGPKFEVAARSLDFDVLFSVGNLDMLKEIEGDDRAVLLETGVNNWYRVELAGGCRYRDFRFAHQIGIDTRPGGGCLGRGDAILVGGSGRSPLRCIVTQINEWDDKAPPPEEAKPE